MHSAEDAKPITPAHVARFLERLPKFRRNDDECWLWDDWDTRHGRYGKVCAGSKSVDPNPCRRVHRVSYVAFKGEIPHGQLVMHSCDVKACVNPAHLEVGTVQQNARDAQARGLLPARAGWRGRRGVPLSEEHKAKTAASLRPLRKTCLDCGMVSIPGAMGMHARKTGHSLSAAWAAA